MTHRIPRTALHRREIRQLKRRLAAGERLVELLATQLQLQPVAESYFKMQVGMFAGAIARILTPKPKPEAQTADYTGATMVKP